MGLISSLDVARLNNHALRAILNALLTAEAGKNNVPLTELDLTLRDNDRDAGIDGRIVWPQGADHDLFCPGAVVVQYKSGKITKKEIHDEFMKPGVQDNLHAEKGQYTLFVSHDYVTPSRDRHKAQLKKLCEGQGIDPTRCNIAYGDHIAGWISRFPGVVPNSERDTQGLGQ